jgi:hypothetical protein
MSTPENRSDLHNEELIPTEVDRVREIMRLVSLGNTASPAEVGQVGTSELEDQQMRKFDETAEATPREIVDNGVPVLPKWLELLGKLPPNPAIYESRFVRDSYYRFDTTITAAGTSATLLLPMVPHGKYAFLDEIHIAQVSGAGSSPNGYLTDQGVAQLFAVITPDGSTFGASYKSGRNVISDDGMEAADVYTDNTKAQVRELGPYDFDGMYQND